MDKEQTKYLLERLSEVSRTHRYDKRPKIKKPNIVRSSEKILAAWEKKRGLAEDRRETKIDKVHNKVREAILFGDDKKALAALRAFEKMKF